MSTLQQIPSVDDDLRYRRSYCVAKPCSSTHIFGVKNTWKVNRWTRAFKGPWNTHYLIRLYSQQLKCTFASLAKYTSFWNGAPYLYLNPRYMRIVISQGFKVHWLLLCIRNICRMNFQKRIQKLRGYLGEDFAKGMFRFAVSRCCTLLAQAVTHKHNPP